MIPLKKRIDLERVVSTALTSRAGEARDSTGRLYVSDLSRVLDEGSCLAALWYRYRGEPQKDPTIGQLLMFHNGNRLHEDMVEFIAEYLPEGYSIVGSELSLGLDPWDIAGRLDLEIEDEENECLVVIDFKTQRGQSFQYLQRRNEAKPADQLQLQAYMKERNADYGILFYIDREGQNGFKQFYVERDDEAVEAAAQKLREVVDAEEPPELLKAKLVRNHNKGNDSVRIETPWQVSYCNLQECRCKKSIGSVPKGVIGHITDKDKVIMKKKYKKWEKEIQTRVDNGEI